MTPAIIGVGDIGGPLARRLVGCGGVVDLAAKDQPRAQALADELGPVARAASVSDRGAGGDLAQVGLNGELLDLDQAHATVAAELPG